MPPGEVKVFLLRWEGSSCTCLSEGRWLGDVGSSERRSDADNGLPLMAHLLATASGLAFFCRLRCVFPLSTKLFFALGMKIWDALKMRRKMYTKKVLGKESCICHHLDIKNSRSL